MKIDLSKYRCVLDGVEPSQEVETAVDSMIDTDWDDDRVVYVKSSEAGMPVISLHYVTFFNPKDWSLMLCLGFPAASDGKDNALHSLFKNSCFSSFFQDYGEVPFLYLPGEDEEDTVRYFCDLKKDRQLALKLMTYYISCFGMKAADCRIEVRRDGEDEDEGWEGLNLDDDLEDGKSHIGLQGLDELIHMALYGFEFKFLPQLGREMTPNKEGVSKLSDKNYVFHLAVLSDQAFFLINKDAIEITRIKAGDDIIVVWTMPQPKESPLARYLAFVPDRTANNFTFYTLEKAHDFGNDGPTWVLGRVSKESIANLGFCAYPDTPQAFVDLINEH